LRGEWRVALLAVCEAYGKLLATSSASNGRNTPNRRFFLLAGNRLRLRRSLRSLFSFCAYGFKEKAAKEFRLFKGGRTQFAPTVNTPMVSKKSG